MKYCINCKWINKSELDVDSSKCLHDESRHITIPYNKYISPPRYGYKSCINMRENIDLCSPKDKFFEERKRKK